MNYKLINLLIIVSIFFSCKKEENKKTKIHFYHWKVDATLTKKEKEALTITDKEKTFIHYFDVVQTENVAHPVAVIQNIDEFFKNKEVVPVVFIRNSVFQNKEISIEKIAEKTEKLVQQIHQQYFNKNTQEIQIDCDWSGTTKEKYFQFLNLLNQKLTTSATIRLHQIKYAEKTGVPPVDYGVLMLYNVSDLSNFKENSILNNTVVKQYIDKKSSYPLTLDVALPLFSQIVVKNKEGSLRLINHAVVNDLEKDTIHFKKMHENIYKVKEKTLYRGHYLYKDFLLKVEKSDEREVVKSYEMIKKSNLKTRNIVLYHLDETELQEHTFEKFIHALK